MFRRLFIIVNCATMLLFGAASPVLSEEPKLIKVPLVRQATNYTCGAAALQSLLAFYGEDIGEDALAKAVKSNSNDGTRYGEIAKFLKSKGYTVSSRTNMTLEELEAKIDAGQPVICLTQAWPDKPVDYAKDWDDGHYVVAVGHDTAKLYFMDPATVGNYTYIPKNEFLQRWHDTDGKEKLVHFGMMASKGKPVFRTDAIKPME